MTGRGFKAKYDYVEILVEPRNGVWGITLRDLRHAETVEHDELFATADDAKTVALSVAQHHIQVRHNDTLLARPNLTWQDHGK